MDRTLKDIAAESKAHFQAGEFTAAYLCMKEAQEQVTDGKVDQLGDGTLVVNRPGVESEVL